MHSARALAWLLLLGGWAWGGPVAASQRHGPESPVYVAEVLRVIDGDTMEVRVQIWPGLTQTTHVRLRDVDMPELRAACEDQRRLAVAARDFLRDVLSGGQPVHLHRVGLDKYGNRVDADVVLPDGRNIADLLRDRFRKQECR